ncbi:Pput_2613-like deaminase [Paraburkholderia steynii]|uniref:Pput_2613-like deaminase n=1 Tax=Paraburkholderia steynii TaxID=1245441 RepID=A0A7Z7FP83_9BURK|nr:hypothetical protein [Paraburkholderia steynii]SDJ51447.1 Pput_2613-like deaminase [Paraburkholderia steynii]
MNEALKDTRSKEAKALREAAKKQGGFTPEEIQLSQQKARELAKSPANVHAIEDPVYDSEIELPDGKKYRRMKGRDVWCLFKNPVKCDPGFSSEVNQAADKANNSTLTPIPSEVLEQYRKLTEFEIFRRAGDEADEIAWTVIRERYPSNEAALRKILGSEYRQPHIATAIQRRAGRELTRMKLQSGGVANLPAGEKALKWPLSSLATHTERWALRNIPLQPGDVLDIIGQYDPCGSCIRAMEEAAERTGATIKYWWPGGSPGLTFGPG